MSAHESEGFGQKAPTKEREARVMNGWIMLPIALLLYIAGPLLIVFSFIGASSSASGSTRTHLVHADRRHPRHRARHPPEPRVLRAAAQRGARAHPLRRLQGHRQGRRVPLGQPLLQQRAGDAVHRPVDLDAEQGEEGRGVRPGAAEEAQALQDLAAGAYAQRRQAQGQRQARQPRGHRRRRGLERADTARAVFDVDDFEVYVATQSETAVRHLASAYPYDSGETFADSDDEITLRGNVDEVSEALRVELAARLAQAGVTVEQARLTHLAYAPEIAQAMLRRQQAEAVIAARRKIVTGAVSMVDMALKDLSEKGVVEFDEERKAAMISNLMVVLCGETQVTPVVNTGTLYQ